ncbi:MAG: rhamnan synthesis F family protein [Paracoccaceae bacterium]
MLRLISYVHTVSLYPAARVIVTAQSEWQRIKTFGQKPVVHFEQAYDGRRIMLLALYEKGVLRPDVMRLLRAARAEGLYILAVNTLKLRDPMALEGLVDCYIERPNFGRDFGSYKTGFLHVFRKGWDKTCPRLLMINDSVYFSEERLPKFLNDMMTSEVEVLGSTENYEIEYHLGSFCIAMAQSILQRPLFQSYWKGYRLTDVRPRVIKRGEMKLSKTLKRCVSAGDQFRSLYSSANFLRLLSEDAGLADFVIKNSRTSDLTGWERFGAKSVISFLSGRFIAPLKVSGASEDATVRVDAKLDELNEESFVQDVASLKAYVERNLKDDIAVDQSLIDDSITSVLSSIFMSGSQIHQNAATLVHLGLPIIKLDGFYRGMFNVYDIQRIVRLLDRQEKSELEQILLERPYGGSTLIGWKRAAFMVGLI